MFVEAPQAQVSREYLGQYLVKQLFNVQARKQEARKGFERLLSNWSIEKGLGIIL